MEFFRGTVTEGELRRNDAARGRSRKDARQFPHAILQLPAGFGGGRFLKVRHEMIVGFLLTLIAAYLVGSIPTGYLVARAKGVDLRAHGSGNIGATNAFRVLGKGPGIFVLLMDAFKGAAAVNWVPLLTASWVPGNAGTYLPLVAGVGAILGHNYTCWLRFKGGKGIATSAGVMGALLPWALVIALSTWFLVLVISRYMSIASIMAAVALPIGTYFTTSNRALWVLAAVLGGMAIWRHRGNIQRLRAGTEPRFEFRSKRSDTPPPS
jgi:glycerol-3-phosphate acyltransferase PlsY